jgi:hypothetical protein
VSRENREHGGDAGDDGRSRHPFREQAAEERELEVPRNPLPDREEREHRDDDRGAHREDRAPLGRRDDDADE